MEDAILIHGLELHCHIGVPDAERTAPQRLTANLRLIPLRDFRALNDDLANTIDYAAVCEAVTAVAGVEPRRLVETLANDIASHLLTAFPIRCVDLELRKYILPGTEYVAVAIHREAE